MKRLSTSLLPIQLKHFVLKRSSLLGFLIVVFASVSSAAQAQCCDTNAYPSDTQLGFENTLVPDCFKLFFCFR